MIPLDRRIKSVSAIATLTEQQKLGSGTDGEMTGFGSARDAALLARMRHTRTLLIRPQIDNLGPSRIYGLAHRHDSVTFREWNTFERPSPLRCEC